MSRILSEAFESWWEKRSEEGAVSPIDRALAVMVDRHLVHVTPEARLLGVVLASALSRSRREGHVLIDLDEAPGHPLVRSWLDALPPREGWAEILLSLPVVGGPGQKGRLMILDGRFLYFRGLYLEEGLVASSVRGRLSSSPRSLSSDEQQMILGMAGSDGNLRDILERALTRSLFLLTGGPGTGKTYTSSKILEGVLKIQPHRSFVVATSTGKAAQRFRESLAVSGIEVVTLHRLLGMSDRGFRYGANRPLPYDLVLLDECSMLDLSLIAQLLRSMTKDSALILVGDKNQLSSVGPGSVFGDLSDTLASLAVEDESANRSLYVLRRNWRQEDWQEFGRLAHAVSEGESGRALEILDGCRNPDGPLVWLEPRSGEVREVGSRLVDHWRPVVFAADEEEAESLLGSFALLGGFREGSGGTRTLNRLLWRHFESLRPRGTLFFPIIIVENSYETGMMNGDMGILKMVDRKPFEAFFPGPAGKGRSISPALLPPWEGAFAMTIHKSQGSEFDHVFVYLGGESHPLLTRSLLYTAITRARKGLSLYGSRALLGEAIGRVGGRSTGLAERLKRDRGGSPSGHGDSRPGEGAREGRREMEYDRERGEMEM